MSGSFSVALFNIAAVYRGCMVAHLSDLLSDIHIPHIMSIWNRLSIYCAVMTDDWQTTLEAMNAGDVYTDTMSGSVNWSNHCCPSSIVRVHGRVVRSRAALTGSALGRLTVGWLSFVMWSGRCAAFQRNISVLGNRLFMRPSYRPHYASCPYVCLFVRLFCTGSLLQSKKRRKIKIGTHVPHGECMAIFR